MLHYYYGFGKGKTTAAVGAAVRATGQNFRVVFAQFLKGNSSGEITPLKQLGVRCLHAEEPFVLNEKTTQQKNQLLALSYKELLQKLLQLLPKTEMLILDEFGDLPAMNLLSDELLNAVLQQGRQCEIIITGHELEQKIAAKADYITCFQAIAHPYSQGVTARKGIEF